MINFFKERRKKRILEEIYVLKQNAAQLSQSSKSAKLNVDDLTAYIHLRQKEAENGDFATSVYLSCYLEGLLKERTKYLDTYALDNQKYLNVIDNIHRLEKELERL